jgi:hypothetical protein
VCASYCVLLILVQTQTLFFLDTKRAMYDLGKKRKNVKLLKTPADAR